jgi:hypothetical protein
LKSLIQAIAIAVTLAIPAMSYAQSNQPVTRAKARSELVQLEKAGYDPAIGHKQYPKNIQAAEAKVASEKNAESAYGGAVKNTSSSGHALREGAKGTDTPGFPATPDLQRP